MRVRGRDIFFADEERAARVKHALFGAAQAFECALVHARRIADAEEAKEYLRATDRCRRFPRFMKARRADAIVSMRRQ
jgi:hypothetical protein